MGSRLLRSAVAVTMAEVVDPAHVAELAAAEVVDVVELDQVVLGGPSGRSPSSSRLRSPV